jgi:hypothetical protein
MQSDPFGSCCRELKNALDNTSNPLIRVESDGVLYLHTGFIGAEVGVTLIDQAVIFCPFCGKQLQNKQELARKLTAAHAT